LVNIYSDHGNAEAVEISMLCSATTEAALETENNATLRVIQDSYAADRKRWKRTPSSKISYAVHRIHRLQPITSFDTPELPLIDVSIAKVPQKWEAPLVMQPQ
jgi:hypothetical protein